MGEVTGGVPPLGRYTPPGRYTPLGRYTPQVGTPPQAGNPPFRYTPGTGAPPRAVHARRYEQQADGTHPTGMHSCFEHYFAIYSNFSPARRVLLNSDIPSHKEMNCFYAYIARPMCMNNYNFAAVKNLTEFRRKAIQS